VTIGTGCNPGGTAERYRVGGRPIIEAIVALSRDPVCVLANVLRNNSPFALLIAHPYQGTGYRLEIYGTEGTLALMGGGNAGEEVKRKIMGGRKVHKTLQDLHVPDRLKWVPEEVRGLGPGYDMGQMWVKFAEAIRTSTNQRGQSHII
jgi:hypothetical protein